MKWLISLFFSFTVLFFHTSISAKSFEDIYRLKSAEQLALHDAAMDVLRKKICRKKFRDYVRRKPPKAFAFTVDPSGRYYQCEYSQAKQKAHEYALYDCNFKRNKSKNTKKNTPECKLLAQDNTLLISPEDFKLEVPTAPLIYAVKHKSFSFIKNMIENGADIHQTEKYGNHALNIAVMENRKDVVEYLVEKGSDLKHTDKYGMNALHVAAHQSNLEIFKLLLSKGADINSTAGRDKKKIIHHAVLNDYGVFVEYLIDLGVDIDATDKLQMTALHHAIKASNFKTMKVLVENGANLHIKNHKGQTPVDLTKKHKKSKTRDYLISKGAKFTE